MLGDSATQDALYEKAAQAFGQALARLAAGYESDADLRRDLLQDIHFALWRSLAGFDGRCSLRTWVFRIAHNVAATHAERGKRGRKTVYADLDDLALMSNGDDPEREVGDRTALAKLSDLIQRLKPPDKQIMLSYLEDLDTAAISEITGLSPSRISSRIHRVKLVLAKHFQSGGNDVR